MKKILGGMGKGGAFLAALVGLALAFLLLRNKKASLTVGGVALGLGLLLWGGHSVERAVGREEGLALSRAPLSVDELPAWMDPKGIAEIHRRYIAPLPGGVTDRDAAARVAASLAQAPWIRSVDSVSLRTDAVALCLSFRQPVARVAWGSGSGWVDEDGILLPKAFYRLPSVASSTPLITGVRHAPPKAAGACWEDPGLQAALEILRRVRSEEGIGSSRASDLQTIDVGNLGERRGDQPELVCMTRSRLALRFSVSGRPGRPSLDEQFGRLRQVVSVDPQLALARSYVDLRFDRPVGS